MYRCKGRDSRNTAQPEILKTYQRRQISHVANVFKYTLSHNEPPRQWLPCLLLDYPLQHPLQVFHVAMLVPSNCASRNLNPLPYCVPNSLVGNDNVSTFRECRYDTANNAESLRVDDACRYSQMCCHVGLCLHVHIHRTVEAWRSARSNSIRAQRRYGLFLKRLVADKVVEVIRSQVRHCAAIGEAGARASRTWDIAVNVCRPSAQLRNTYPTITALFSSSASSNALEGATNGSGVQSLTRSSTSYPRLSDTTRSAQADSIPTSSVRSTYPLFLGMEYEGASK